MGRRLILDTGALIAFERGTLQRDALDDDDLAIAAITVAEFRTGIELADTPERAAGRARTLTAILDAIVVLDYTARTAAEHARLLAHVRRAGAARGAHDVIIAAHAVEHGRAVVSLDARARFDELPGVLTATP
ncbi:PIN domain-containing protein [Cellulomonas sp. Sa3CUA2]|uniref:Ribonuclease VapC n=1 Tax=Cellulomonas avistercoris TaxID=2762242 RepID=A0ABR8QHF4_9CELL|nr:PIN domain-containing protein [Cellulomonas avistercoris]MBD7919830.1 PIN domain-containing protein [Cellulomonas avistercoris]